jgi:hypothetical protein
LKQYIFYELFCGYHTQLLIFKRMFLCPQSCATALQIPTPASKVSGGSSANSSPSLRYLAHHNVGKFVTLRYDKILFTEYAKPTARKSSKSFK